jgi:peroxiredoxin
LQQHKDAFASRNIKIVVITFEQEPAASAFACKTGLPWPLLIDVEKKLYSGCGMTKAGFSDIWGLQTWKAYAKEMAKGRLPKKSNGDIYQRGGDILIDPKGVVRLHHVGAGPADRPSVESILALIK